MPLSQYSSGKPATYGPPTAGGWVSTGWRIDEIPVFAHRGHVDGRSCDHLVGVDRRRVETGYTVPASTGEVLTPDVPWATGRSTADEGCDACRALAEHAHYAQQCCAELERRHQELAAWTPDGELPSPPVSAEQDREQAATTVVLVFVAAALTVLALAVIFGANLLASAVDAVVLWAVPYLLAKLRLRRRARALEVAEQAYDARMEAFNTEREAALHAQAQRVAAMAPAVAIARREHARLAREVAQQDDRQREQASLAGPTVSSPARFASQPPPDHEGKLAGAQARLRDVLRAELGAAAPEI